MSQNIFYEIGKKLDEGIGVALVTITKKEGSSPGKLFETMIVYENGDFTGTIGGGITEKNLIDEALECIKTGMDKNFSKDYSTKSDLACGGKAEGFIKVFLPKKKLIIFGAGHVSRSICKTIENLDFSATVIDDREEYKLLPEFKNVKYIAKDVESAVKDIAIDENTYIIAVTRSHKLDTDALFAIKDTKPKYIGMIGSGKKVKVVFDDLLENGVTQAFLDRVTAPIGYRFDDGSPEEIAISIVAQLLEVKNSK